MEKGEVYFEGAKLGVLKRIIPDKKFSFREFSMATVILLTWVSLLDQALILYDFIDFFRSKNQNS
jgi:hypothetical protein